MHVTIHTLTRYTYVRTYVYGNANICKDVCMQYIFTYIHTFSHHPRGPQSAGNPFGDDHMTEDDEGDRDGLGEQGLTVQGSGRRGGRDIYSYRIDQGRLDEEDNFEEDEEDIIKIDPQRNQNETSGV